MQSLTNLQLSQVSGGLVQEIQEFVPAAIPGYELIGWQQVLTGYDTTSWEEKGWFFTSYHVEKSPIYEFTPIFACL